MAQTHSNQRLRWCFGSSTHCSKNCATHAEGRTWRRAIAKQNPGRNPTRAVSPLVKWHSPHLSLFRLAPPPPEKNREHRWWNRAVAFWSTAPDTWESSGPRRARRRVLCGRAEGDAVPTAPSQAGHSLALRGKIDQIGDILDQLGIL